jgi:PHD/YefM family antitoxin component YafN of YafNO toxin-antitoxin module
MPTVSRTLQEPGKILEEQLEFSNVTDLRQDFLRKIEEIQKNPALRLLILKHGRPQAVLMSSEAYDVLKKVVKLFLDHAEGLNREQSINAAIRRFEAERSSVPAEPEMSVSAASSKLAAE